MNRQPASLVRAQLVPTNAQNAASTVYRMAQHQRFVIAEISIRNPMQQFPGTGDQALRRTRLRNALGTIRSIPVRDGQRRAVEIGGEGLGLIHWSGSHET
jgi:hypothetical protein